MTKETKNRIQHEEDDSIDIVALLKQLWVARKTIVKITIVFLFLGLFVAIFSKKEFSASTTFVPVDSSESLKGNLGGLASLAGISLGSNSTGAEISPKLYPQIFNSTPFQIELLNTLLTIEGEEQPVTYKEFYRDIYKPGLLENIRKYTLGLPSLILSSFRSDNEQKEGIPLGSQIINISLEEYDLIDDKLVNQISLNVNEKEGFVTISVTLPEAIASAQFALKAQELLQDYALKFKTQKSTEHLKYIEARFLEKQKEFNSVKLAYARFQDQNTNINTALGNTKLLQLQSDYDLIFSVYSELAKQLETQLLQVKKDTPLFTVLKPVSIPKEKSAPKRSLIMAVFLFLGFILGLVYVLLKRSLADLKKEWLLNNR